MLFSFVNHRLHPRHHLCLVGQTLHESQKLSVGCGMFVGLAPICTKIDVQLIEGPCVFSAVSQGKTRLLIKGHGVFGTVSQGKIRLKTSFRDPDWG